MQILRKKPKGMWSLWLMLCLVGTVAAQDAAAAPLQDAGKTTRVAFAPRLATAARQAVPKASQDRIKSALLPPLRSYFLGEKLSGFWWGGVGLAGAGVGVGLLFVDSPIAYGMAFPMMIIGGLQLLIGITALARTDARVAGYVKDIDKDAAAFYAKERKRMDFILLAFKIIKWVEIGVMATGIGLVMCGMVGDIPVMAGVGLGLMVKGMTMLIIDLFAQQRAQWYVRQLRGISPTITPVAATLTTPQTVRVGLAWQGSF